MTTALGLSLGVLWEIFEWFGHTFIDGEIYVGYSGLDRRPALTAVSAP